MTDKKVALVTGVSSGIGRAAAERLLAAGFRVFGSVRDSSRLDSLPRGLEPVRLDVRDEDSIRAAVQSILEHAGRIDALVNNAGYALLGAAEETSLEEAKSLFETNFFGVLRMTRAVLPVMRRQGGGRIVNISSVGGFLPLPYMAVYAAGKHALEGYSESLDHEVRQFGIRVSLVEPGFTRTALGRHGQYAGEPLEAYSGERAAALAAIQKQLDGGDAPAVVAAVVVRALTDRVPRLRYQSGRAARWLRRLRTWAPAKMLDRGLREQFGLGELKIEH